MFSFRVRSELSEVLDTGSAVPFPVWVSPAAPSRWRCPAEQRSALSPADTNKQVNTRLMFEQVNGVTARSSHLFPLLPLLNLPAERNQLPPRTRHRSDCKYTVSQAGLCCTLTRYLLPLEDQLAHADQVLSDFGESLFTLVSDEARPVNQVLVDLFQSFLVVFTELHLRQRINTYFNNTSTQTLTVE